MRGYLSFVLVFICTVILLSSYAYLSAAYSYNLSKAVSVERTYGLQLNIKEVAIESIRQGMFEGFSDYDTTHEIAECVHCPGMCAPPPSPNVCNPVSCLRCFREDEARDSAMEGAYTKLSLLSAHSFDDTFSVNLIDPQLDVSLKPDPLSRNGFSVDYAVLHTPLKISVESKELGISAVSQLPHGMVING